MNMFKAQNEAQYPIFMSFSFLRKTKYSRIFKIAHSKSIQTQIREIPKYHHNTHVSKATNHCILNGLKT